MNDAEFRRRAHALLSFVLETPEGEWTNAREEEMAHLVAAGPSAPSLGGLLALHDEAVLGKRCCPCCGNAGVAPCPAPPALCCVQRGRGRWLAGALSLEGVN